MLPGPDTSSEQVDQSRCSDPWPRELGYLPRRARVFVISGPAGVGKDAVIGKLVERDRRLRKVVTNTTRAPRDGEREGIDYHFCSREEFDRLLEADSLLEHARYDEHFYGTPAEPVRVALAEGFDVLLKIEAQGAMRVKARVPGSVLVFLAPESLAELRDRMSRRNADKAESMARRLERAADELCLAGLYDYVVVNRHEQVEEAVEEVATIIRAERLRANPHPVDLG